MATQAPYLSATPTFKTILNRAATFKVILLVASVVYLKVSETNGQTNVNCDFSLILPDGCTQDTVDLTPDNQSVKISVELTVLKFHFLSQSEPGRQNLNENHTENSNDGPQSSLWLEERREFCIFQELLNFPPACIEQRRNVRYMNYVRCPREDAIELSGPALWTKNTTYQNSNQTYRDDTTGLVMKCTSQELLQLRSSEKTQFSGVGVKLGKTRPKSNEASNTPSSNDVTLNWLQMQIPSSLKSGTLEGYSGNYTLFFKDGRNRNEEINVKNYEILMNPPSRNSTRTSAGIKIDILPNRVRCKAQNNDNIYLAAIGGENPLETDLLSKCLPREITCEQKSVGVPCFQNRPCSVLESSRIQLNGLLFCSHGDENLTMHYFTGLDVLTEPFVINDIQSLPSSILIQIQVDDGLKLVQVLQSDDDDEGKNENENDETPMKKMIVYENEPNKFECHYQPYILVPAVTWTIRFRNQSKIQVHVNEADSPEIRDEQLQMTNKEIKVTLDIKSAKFDAKFTREMLDISCGASYWNSPVFAQSSILLEVLPSTIPSFGKETVVTEESFDVDAGQYFNLTCKTLSSAPPPTYEWKFNGKKISSNENCIKVTHEESTGSSYLSICNAGKSHEGTFTCRATNFLGWAENEFPVKVIPPGNDGWIYFGVACGIIITLLPALFFLYTLYLNQRAQLSQLEIEAFENGDEKELKKNRFAHENAQFLPYNRDYEIEWKYFEQLGDDLLGEGAYGIVVKGKIKERIVAAKTVRPTAEKAVVLALLSELKIMIYIEKHPFIVELVGACTSMLRQGRPYVFVEFCENGNLNSFLKKSRPHFVDTIAAQKGKPEGNLAASDPLNGLGTAGFSDIFSSSKPAAVTDHETPPPKTGDDEDSADESTPLTTPSTSERRVTWSKAVPNEYNEEPGSNRSSKKEVQIEIKGETEPIKEITTIDLLKWASDIASGMEYLESKKVIHGDLAARNVLVTGSYNVKITDFGLSRQLQKDYTEYVKKQPAALPWRWMAIESLCDMVFTHKSDVWAFGITVWEMFTLAELPFPGLNWTMDFIENLKGSLRPPKPQYADDQIYKIMLDCWQSNPEDRPDFAQLKRNFALVNASLDTDRNAEYVRLNSV